MPEAEVPFLPTASFLALGPMMTAQCLAAAKGDVIVTDKRGGFLNRIEGKDVEETGDPLAETVGVV